MTDELRDIYRALESRYVHEGRTIDPSFYRDLSDDSMAKFANIGFDCLLSLDEQICPWFIYEFYKTLHLDRDPSNHLSIQLVINNHRFNISLDQFAELTSLPNQGICIYSDAWKMDNPSILPTSSLGGCTSLETNETRKMSSLKAKQPKKPPPKRTRNVGKSKRVELTTSSSTESPPSDNGDLPSTKFSPRSYSRALPPDPNMSKEQKKTIGMFKNLGRALQQVKKMLKKDVIEGSFMCETIYMFNYRISGLLTCLLESACLDWMLKLLLVVFAGTCDPRIHHMVDP
ncbi:hypothetical protein Tco_0960988 [Tanacetum coccineum]